MQSYDISMAVRHPSPVFLVRCALAGAVLATASWFLAFTPVRHLQGGHHGFANFLSANWLRIISIVGPLSVGLLISFLSEHRFKQAYTNDAWTDNELAPVRKLLQRSFWTWGSIIVLAACAATLIFRKNISAGSFIYILIYPFNFANRIRVLISPPVIRNGGFINWRTSKPLQSEHWGE